jgi:hypothetical protein
VTVDEHERRIATHLDMVLMDFERPERPVIELTWRAAIAVPRKRERLSKVLVTNAYNVSEALWGPQDDERHAHHATEAASGS